MTPFHVIIPARFASTRLPGKVLREIGGLPMLEHVYKRAKDAGAQTVTVATDDEQVRETCKRFGATAQMTSGHHQSGTDRIAECAGRMSFPDNAIIINLQADEPLTPPHALWELSGNMGRNPKAHIGTLCSRIQSAQELHDPDAVKVVMDAYGNALYFSRAPIPYNRDAFRNDAGCLPPTTAYYRHIGIYAYRASFLRQFSQLAIPAAESAENLEQLRALHYGYQIHVGIFQGDFPAGVDTENDLRRVERFMQQRRR
jgi:3-deoxy-manno-octulosonate cytidylyltransferase (CMP-KDO synthetase)